jgi:hypothetical protein
MSRSVWWCLPALVVASLAAPAQVIRFESGGLNYQTLSRGGLTTMYAHLPSQVREYTIVQAAVTNGSKVVCTVQPEAFAFRFPDGRDLRAEGAEAVVTNLLEKASRNDVIRLIATYEIGLYGLSRYKSTSGYEQRRQAAQAIMTSTKLNAAAAASAIAFVETKLKPGDSTDGAVFFPAKGRPLEGSRLRVTACGQLFEFDVEPASH